MERRGKKKEEKETPKNQKDSILMSIKLIRFHASKEKQHHKFHKPYIFNNNIFNIYAQQGKKFTYGSQVTTLTN